jgi:sulfopyruvate decarboxylase subunit beta
MMRRDLAFEALAAVRDGAIVVATYSSAFEWERISPSPLNLPATGAMGQGSSHGLGLALGLPDTKVIVLDGDGSLLMNLGSLVTIAAAGPKNLVHFVCENGVYEANGSHPIPGRGTVDFSAMAEAAGYRHASTYSELTTFAEDLPRLMCLDGPVFATLKLVAGETPLKLDYQWMHGPQTRAAFKRAILSLLPSKADS